jgi:hypothetical protein
MKQTPIAEPAKRTEGSIIDDIAAESERLGAAQQEAAVVQDRRARLVATGTLDEVRALADSVDRAGLQMEISQARIEALNQELKRFYATEARAALDAAMKPLSAIDAEELQVVKSYEAHAAAVAVDLAKLQALDSQRHQVSVAVHRLTGTWTPFVSPAHRASLGQVRLPSAEGGADHWPVSPRVVLLDAQARAARDAQALAEYHQENE